MEGVIALLMPVMIVWIVSHYRHRTKMLAQARPPDAQALEAAAKEKKLLEARIQNLESIVCSVDHELNQRLNRLAAGASAAGAAPALPSSAEPPQLSLVSGATRPASPFTQAAGPAAALAPAPAAAALTAPLGQLAPGTVLLGRYTIERELGRGGMGAVYVAQDAKLGERVALKTIASNLAGDAADLAARFRREVQAARKITHPNVIRIHDLGEDGPLLFLSMEYVEGETLWARVRRLGRLPVRDATEILSDVAAGVAAAHAAGVVHRDLKPQNVLLGAGGRGQSVKVIDFGLATASFMTGMTATGMIMGTPEYMAPEQIRGRPTDARTDVYALGAMAYCALTGQPPFVGDTPIAVGFAQVNDEPRPLQDVRSDVPAPLSAAVMKALAKDPAARFADATDWRTALGPGSLSVTI